MDGDRLKTLIISLIGMKNWNKIKLINHMKADKKNGNGVLLNQNKQFKEKYFGKRCFIVGNGPSAKMIDTHLLKGEIVFTVNQFPKADNYEKLNPTFHFWADEQFFDLHEGNPGDMSTLETMRNANKGKCHPTVFYKISAKEMIKKYKLDEELDICYFSAGQTMVHTSHEKFDLSRYVPWFPTVVQYCIAAAIYMGFKEIYLLGCECTGFVNLIKVKDPNNQSQDEYAFQMNKAESERFRKRVDARTSAEEMWGHYEVLHYYEKLKVYCDGLDIKLVNCTYGGILDSLPRMKLEEVIRGVSI